MLFPEPNQLRYLAKVVRSKNSGPFEITCDVSAFLLLKIAILHILLQVMFDTEEGYNRAVNSGVLNRDLISKLYNVPDEKILTCMFVSICSCYRDGYLPMR
jgi:hypothetical protein